MTDADRCPGRGFILPGLPGASHGRRKGAGAESLASGDARVYQPPNRPRPGQSSSRCDSVVMLLGRGETSLLCVQPALTLTL